MTQIDHGGNGDTAKRAPSYADRAKMNIKYDQRLKRNVLEIEVEKKDRDDELILDQNSIAKLCGTIGLDVKLVEGYQVSYGGKISKIKV